MAKNRYVNTRFWNDSYIAELNPQEKLLFLYFLTNSATNICGAYELPLRNIALETGIDRKLVEDILSRFSRDGKVHYMDGWVVISNFAKHQNQKSPQVIKGILAELEEIPEKLRGYVQGMDTLSHLDINSNSNLDINTKPHASLKYLTDIPLEDLKAFCEKYEASVWQVKRKGEQMSNYCDAKGKTYKNYRAFLENGLDKDFGRRVVAAPVLPKEPRPVPTPEEAAKIAETKKQINDLVKSKRFSY